MYFRGRTGARTRFGNELILAENSGGLIVDHPLYGKGAPSEPESVERQQTHYAEFYAVTVASASIRFTTKSDGL